MCLCFARGASSSLALGGEARKERKEEGKMIRMKSLFFQPHKTEEKNENEMNAAFFEKKLVLEYAFLHLVGPALIIN